MNIIGTHITNNKSGGVSSVNTASITPVPNRLYLVTVYEDSDSVDPAQPSISGCNLTWELVRTKTNNSDARQRVSIFRGMGANPTSGQLTISLGGSVQSIFWSVDEFKLVKKGANGANAVIQSNDTSSNSVEPINMTVSLSAFANTKNATFAVAIGPDIYTTPSGFSELFVDNQDLGPDNNVGAWFKDSNATSVNIQASGSGARGAIGMAVEIGIIKRGGFLTHL